MGAGMLGNINDIDLRMLRTFCAIVEAGGFTAAQARLNTSLSRLSVLVRDLEVRLGYSLCRRGNGGFQLTEEGQELYDAALGLFSDIARFREQVRGLGGRDREALHLGCVDGVIGQHCLPLPLAIRLFRQRAPEVLLKLHTRRPDELEHAVLEERLQLAVGAFHHRLSGLYYQPLFREEQNLYCGSAHPFFARADDEPTLGEICAADYVGRGYMAENHRPHDLRFNQGPTPTPWRPSLPWSSAAPTSATCRRTMPPPGSPKGACGRSGHGNWPTTRNSIALPARDTKNDRP
ncbi:hypothetical protein PA6761_00428 [Pseudomonas aeruginosa]